MLAPNIMMTNYNKVVLLAKQTRVSLEILVKKTGCKDVLCGPTLCGFCGVGSVHLQNLAAALNIKVDLCQGTYTSNQHRSGHCWIECDKKIIDITGTQFSQDITDPVCIFAVDNSRYRVYSRNEKARHILSAWPSNQNYKTYEDDLVNITYHLCLEIIKKAGRL